jgi:hypothetical protein
MISILMCGYLKHPMFGYSFALNIMIEDGCYADRQTMTAELLE